MLESISQGTMGRVRQVQKVATDITEFFNTGRYLERIERDQRHTAAQLREIHTTIGRIQARYIIMLADRGEPVEDAILDFKVSLHDHLLPEVGLAGLGLQPGETERVSGIIF